MLCIGIFSTKNRGRNPPMPPPFRGRDLESVGWASTGRATRIHARIQAATNLLLSRPRIGLQTENPTIRRINTAPYPYLIFNQTTENEIIIHTVCHGARDPSGMPGSP